MIKTIFQQLVDNEFERIKSKRLKPFNNFHEAYGKLCEEIAEFFEEVRSKDKTDKENTLLELVQIAVVCERAAKDLLNDLLMRKAAVQAACGEAEWDSIL